MKRILSMFLTLTVAFVVLACGAKTNQNASFGKGKDRLIITTGGMGWEKMFSFI